MEDYIVMPKMKRLILLAVLSAGFVALGILFIAISLSEQELMLLVIGGITVVVFGFCFLYYVIVLIKREPALIISKEGIIDHSSFIGAGLVRWDDMEKIDFINFSGQIYLGIFTSDRDLIINRMEGIKRIFCRLNKGLLESQVNIPVKILDCPMEELVEDINRKWAMSAKEQFDA